MDKKLIFGTVGALLIFSVVFVRTRATILRGEPDFAGFYTAGKIIVQGNAHRLYDWELQKQTQQDITAQLKDRTFPLAFNHAPFEALLFAVFALLPYAQAVTLWFLCNIAMLGAALLLLRRRLLRMESRFHWVLIATAAFMPAIRTLYEGQDSILLLLLFTAAFIALEDKREALAGCLLALATFKPHEVLPLLLCLVVARRWKPVGSFAATGAGLMLLSAAVMGWRVLVDYPRFLVLQFAQRPSALAGVYPEHMPNLRGFAFTCWRALHLPPAAMYPVVAVGSLVLLVLLLRAWARPAATKEIPRLQFSLALAVTILIGFQMYYYDLAVLVLAFLLALEHVAERWRATISQLLIVVSMVAIMILGQRFPPLQVIALLLFSGAVLAELKAVSATVPQTQAVGAGVRSPAS
ncbi:MAG: glycosyltransferase family 87 protein [Terriglobales bacterium]